MGELHKGDKAGHTYSVKVQAIYVGWIFDKANEKYTLRFFDALLDDSNLSLFGLKSLQVLIDYLFHNMEQKLCRTLFPVFLIYSIALFYYAYLFE